MKFSISDLEQLSGIPSHTIRIWEKRYNALTPLRTAGNTRFYNNEQLRKLLNIVSLNQNGLKISQACSLSNDEIEKLIANELENKTNKNITFDYFITQLLQSGLNYNEVDFDNLLNECIKLYGMDLSYKSVIYPLLQRLGLMWQIDKICPAQEHFMSAIIRQKMMVAINALPLNRETIASWLLFLPEDEEHDIGLLFSSYILRKANHKVVYLGGRVPIASIENGFSHNNIDHSLLFMVRNRPIIAANNYVSKLATKFPNINFHLAGNSKVISALSLPSNFNYVNSIDDLEAKIKLIANAK